MTHIIGSSSQGPSKAELLYDASIRDPLAIGDAIQLLRRRNPMIKIGFTNGKFRALTPAHCVFLTLCRSKCDILIVGVNSDYSLRLLKQEAKFTSQERAFALATLGPVDYVTIFDEETPALAISSISPSVVFKGPDYKPEEIVSAPGIPVEVVQHPFDVHFSDLVGAKTPAFQGKYFNLETK